MKHILGIQDNGTKWKAPGMTKLVLSQKEANSNAAIGNLVSVWAQEVHCEGAENTAKVTKRFFDWEHLQ